MHGPEMHALATRLWPINRSLTGDGVRETLAILQAEMPGLQVHEVASGTQAFDWTVPREWRVRSAYIVTPGGERICDFSVNNLHLVGYSAPVHTTLRLADLQPHLYSLPEQPDAIPYITSYYKERWGFCLTQQQRDRLEDGLYEVVVDADLFDGALTYGELVLPGSSDREVLLSTYVCHPSMANNELSGPCVTTYLAKALAARPQRRFTYRIIFIPETIGSIVYLSRHLDHLKAHVVAGFNITCVGDDRAYSYLPSRNGRTLSDRVARHVLGHLAPDFKAYSWLDRGSDERQYCAPGVDLPIASITRSLYGCYPEYHTSLDDLQRVVTPAGLAGGWRALWAAIEALEHHGHPRLKVLCEPQLGKRGLYPSVSTKFYGGELKLMMDFMSYCDGTCSLIEIADLLGCPVWDLYGFVEKLAAHDLIEMSDQPA